VEARSRLNAKSGSAREQNVLQVNQIGFQPHRIRDDHFYLLPSVAKDRTAGFDRPIDGCPIISFDA
jgi:hypothetical protein